MGAQRRYYSPALKASAVKLYGLHVPTDVICETLGIKNANSLNSILRNEGALTTNSHSEAPVPNARAMVHVPSVKRRLTVRLEVMGVEKDKMSEIIAKVEFHKDVKVVDGPYEMKRVNKRSR